MPAKPTDGEAIRRSRDRPEAFAVIYERHHPAIHNYLRRRLGAGAADDVAAETFVHAFNASAGYRSLSESARPWLFGIAANLIGEHRRVEARALRAWQRAAAQVPCSVDLRPTELDPELIAGLRRLSRRDRETLLLLAWGELSYAEIAEALAIPIGTVRSRIHHARTQLTVRATPTVSSKPGEAHA